MKCGRLRWGCAALLLALITAICAGGMAQELPTGAVGVVQATPDPNAGQSAYTGRNLFRIGGYTITLPDDWSVVAQKDGSPQIQFMDTDGKRGLCVIVASRVRAYQQDLDANGLLTEVCKALGSPTYQTQQVGERNVALFDLLLNAEQTVTYAVFMEGMDVYVVQVCILESSNAMRQQALAAEIVGYFNVE